MCLSIPARIIEIVNQMATVEVGGITRQASLMLLPQAATGDYVLVHAGFAISMVDKAEARETLRFFEDVLKGVSDEND